MTNQFTEELISGFEEILAKYKESFSLDGAGTRLGVDFRSFAAHDLLKFLKSKGVVRKLNKELPSIFDLNEDVISALEYRKKLTGYVKVEEMEI